MIARLSRSWLRMAMIAAALYAPSAHAVIYFTGSVSASQSNAGLQTHNSNGGSATVAFDLGRYVRLGFTHRQDMQRSEGYIGATAEDCDFAKEDTLGDRCLIYDSTTHIISNSIDFTLILYEGDVFVPFLQAGGVVKTYTFKSTKGVDTTEVGPVTVGPMPNLGVGMGIRLNREFSLKISYTASPGYVYTPDGKSRSVWDKNTSLGITYQL